MANPGPEYRVTAMERLAAQSVLDHLNEAMDRFEYDNAHGLDSAGDEARAAARKAKTKAELLPDENVRDHLAVFEQALMATLRGWHERGGATKQQMADLRSGHEATMEIVGALLRPVS